MSITKFNLLTMKNMILYTLFFKKPFSTSNSHSFILNLFYPIRQYKKNKERRMRVEMRIILLSGIYNYEKEAGCLTNKLKQ